MSNDPEALARKIFTKVQEKVNRSSVTQEDVTETYHYLYELIEFEIGEQLEEIDI